MPSWNPTSTEQMTTYGRQDIDLRIQVNVPAAGIFTLGQSLLNGSDVLGDGNQWDVYTDEIVEVTHSNRTDLVSAIFAQGIACQATVVVRTPDLNPNVNADVHPNTRVKIDWKPTSSGTWTNLITGFITEISTSYYHDAQPVTTFVVEDMMTRLMNAPILSYSQSANLISGTLSAFFDVAVAAAGLSDGVYVPFCNAEGSTASHGALSYTNVIASEVFNDLTRAELGFMQFVGQELVFWPRDWWSDVAYEGDTADFDSFETGYNSEYLFSEIVVNLTSAPGTLYRKTNTDVSSFFGSIVQTAEVNLENVYQLNQWMASIVSTSPQLMVTSLSIPKFIQTQARTMMVIDNSIAGSGAGSFGIVESTIYVGPTSVSTSMQLYQPL